MGKDYLDMTQSTIHKWKIDKLTSSKFKTPATEWEKTYAEGLVSTICKILSQVNKKMTQ